LVAIRIQAALVRTLLDELERLVPDSEALRPTQAQIADELARLGTRMVGAAADMACREDAVEEIPPGSKSGVHPVAFTRMEHAARAG
jgi:hypothetical protein